MSKEKVAVPKEKAIGILASIKKLLFESMPEVPVNTGTIYKTVDGIEVSVDKLEIGGMAMINGVAAPANTYVFEDGTSIVVDASGKITAVTVPAPPPVVPAPTQQQQAPAQTQQPQNQPAPTSTPAPARFSFKDEDKTTEGIDSVFAKFATGTPEERIANLEVVCKALMEYSFGWEIKQAKEKSDRDQAIAIYTTELANANAQISNQKQAMQQMFSLIEEYFGAPISDPPVETKKKFSFSRVETHSKGIEKFQAAAKKLSEEGFKTRN